MVTSYEVISLDHLAEHMIHLSTATAKLPPRPPWRCEPPPRFALPSPWQRDGGDGAATAEAVVSAAAAGSAATVAAVLVRRWLWR